ncbi:hypothetical protein HDU91_005673, partial [Kappamyces sp. JEL0680]
MTEPDQAMPVESLEKEPAALTTTEASAAEPSVAVELAKPEEYSLAANEPIPEETPKSADSTADTPTADITGGMNDEVQVQEDREPKALQTQAEDPEPRPAAVVVNYEQLLSRFKMSVAIAQFDQAMLTEDHLQLIKDFLTNPKDRKLVLYIDDKKKPATLHVSTALPTQVFSEMAYFIKESLAAGDVLTESNFERKVQYGKLTKNTMESLLKMMSHVYVPIFLGNKKWPDSVRKEFNNQLHKFMAFLTDTTYQMKGHTVLYVPEGYELVVEEAARSKDVVQRLEALLVHWTKQIKEVINAQHTSESTENSGPLEEIQFWRDRCEDLSSISDQINRQDVKEIIRVLDVAKSSFIEQFLRLSNLIHEGTIEAQDNLKFLSLLTDNCTNLAQAEPKNIITILPNLLRTVRLIWANSKYYNTKERLTSLLRKISNEIIRRCCAKISLDEIFHGDVPNAIVSIQDSINCGESWKGIYKKTCLHIAKFTNQQWDFDQSSIFAQIDAFVRRCRDLLEVCEGQLQFARKITGAAKAPIPQFGGVRGPEISKSFEDIEEAFEKHLAILWNIRKHILDVKATRWHDDYNSFKQGVKDLEVMMQNTIIAAFEDSNTVESGTDLLDIFFHLAKRDAIKRTVEKKTADVYQLFLQELNSVKIDFETNKKTPLILRTQPDYAGSCYWAKGLLLRIQSSMTALANAYYLPSTNLAVEARAQYDVISGSIEDYISKTLLEWSTTVGPQLAERLNDVLMVRRGEKLQVKFDRDLLRLFAEISYFQRLKCDIPFHVQELYSKKEELRVLRENVLLVVRDYNKISDILSPAEQLLFRERIKFLDRKVNPGLTNLNWDSKGISDFFIKECRRHLADTHKIVQEFLHCNTQIQLQCNAITQTLLWQIENKRIYDLEAFEASQMEHQSIVRKKLVAIYESVLQTLTATFEIFRSDGPSVYSHWIKYVEGVDSKIEQALRVTVKKSLSEISKAINGEGKSRDGGNAEIHPLFKVNVVLEAQKVEFSPNFSKLQESVNTISREMISTISVFPRLAQKLTPESTTISTKFYDIVSAEEDILKIFIHIQSGMSQNASKCQTYLRNWDTYREIWEINKDAFIRRYAKLKPALSTFDADINRYNEVANNAQKEETLTNINFVRLDCSLLKHALVAHCSAWQSKLTTLLNQNAVTELNSLFSMFSKMKAQLQAPPKDLDQLSEGLILLAQLQADTSKIEAQFAPINEMYAILETYEVPIKEEEKLKLQQLPAAWTDFQGAIAFAEIQLQESKIKFKSELISSSDEYTRFVSTIKDDFINKGPFMANLGVDKALKSIT